MTSNVRFTIRNWARQIELVTPNTIFSVVVAKNHVEQDISKSSWREILDILKEITLLWINLFSKSVAPHYLH